MSRAERARAFSWILLRVAFGGLFVFSGIVKLQNPQLFGFALKALRFGAPDSLLIATAFVLPWWEVLSGSLLALGLWPRAAASVLLGLLLLFTAVIATALMREIAVDCPCFGAFELVCTGPLGVCHLARNAVLALLAAMLIARDLRNRRAIASPAA